VTAVQGQGYEGNVLVIFVVSPRRRESEVLAAVKHVDPEAFITVEPVSRAIGGFSRVSGFIAAGLDEEVSGSVLIHKVFFAGAVRHLR